MTVHRNLPRTLLPLDRWAEIIGIDPRHFRQVTTTLRPVQSCTKVWKQYSWQEADQVGRYDVAQAIQQAEKTFAHYLGYKLIPTWEYEERKNTPKPGNPELLYYTTYDLRGYRLSINADWGHFIEGGVERKLLISAGVTIDYSDEDSDDYYETATISFTATDSEGNVITDEEELAVFYPGESGNDEWEIRPLNTISITGGIATITMWRHQLVDPDLIEALDPGAVDGVTGSFLATVDVYRRYNNPATQVTLIWDPNLYNCTACSDGTTTCCPVCGQTTQTGCLMPKNYEQGWLMYRPASYSDGSWTSEDLTCNRNPDQLLLYYRAGLEDKKRTWPKLQMDYQWERAVAIYALALLDRDMCECSVVKDTAARWREDMARQSPAGGGYRLSDRNLDNPLGTTRAAIYAWNLLKEQDRRLALPVKY